MDRINKFQSGNILGSAKQYLYFVANGEMYEFLATKYNSLTFYENNEIRIKKAMVLTFTIFFNPPRRNSKKRAIFRELFPEVMSLLEDINKYFMDTKKECKKMGFDQNGNNLVLFLQSLESYLFLDVLCKEKKHRYGHGPILTLHHAIATTKEFEPLIVIVRQDICVIV